MSRRGFFAMVIAAGAASVLSSHSAQAFSFQATAKSAQQHRGATMQAGGPIYHHGAMHSYDTRPTHKDPGPIGKRLRKRPCAPVPGRPRCR